MNAATTFARTQRCQVGDLVLLVRSKNPARIGRIGVIVCSTTSAVAAALAHPDDLTEVKRHDWIVDFQGAPDVAYRDGRPIVTHRLACADATLRPLRATTENLGSEAALAVGGAA